MPIKNNKREKMQMKEDDFEPSKVDHTTAVDIDEEYSKYDNEQYLQSKKFPDLSDLEEHELNLREFQISGGIYEINCYERPVQTKQINLKMFLKHGK